MTNLILLLLFNSLIIFGVYASTAEGMIFEKFGKWLDMMYSATKRNRFISKPLGKCPICMSSIYGFPVFWFFYFIHLIDFDYIIIIYICYTFALAGLNYVIISFFSE